MKKNILFIVNPISGGKKKQAFPKEADKYLDKNKFTANFVFTEYSGHAQQAAKEAIISEVDIIVAVGGDGTINEIATILAGTNKLLGIIPCGSGNGLARSMGIPLLPEDAILALNRLNSSQIDTAVFNERDFFNIAGMGFDAHISAQFADLKTRGLKGYVKTTFAEISKYKPQNYIITVDGKTYEHEAFMLSIANSSQYGNNAHIAPNASLTDGLLDVCIIKPFPLYQLPLMGYHMFSNTADKSKYVEIIQGKNIEIVREQSGPVHLDGEPSAMGEKITIGIKHLNLNVLV